MRPLEKTTAPKGIRTFRDSEEGSLLLFSLFIFILLLFMAGMAVDMMRLENRRVAMQNTIDSAILSASSLSQERNATVLIEDYVQKAGFDPKSVIIKDKDTVIGGDLIAREVSAAADVKVDTLFMSMMGIDSLISGSAGAAEESVRDVEISLVLDISGSMGWNNKLDNLKEAAKIFTDIVITQNPRGDDISISIVPYNHVVVAGEPFLSRLNADGTTEVVTNPAPYAGAMTTYPTEHDSSSCVAFSDSDFTTRAISATTPLTRISHFARQANSYNQPGMGQRWCDTGRTPILVHSNNVAILDAHIEGLRSGGWTAIDVGMKWGVALLDPALEPTLGGMVDDGLLTERMRLRPDSYTGRTDKYIIVMTDGENTDQRDLRDNFKNGPSRIWYAESMTTGDHADFGRPRTKYDGYFVEMPAASAAQRWYVPGSPNTTSDDVKLDVGALPADAKQLDYIELHDRFSAEDIAKFFFEHSGDATAYNAHRHGQAAYRTENGTTADLRLAAACAAAKADEANIRVFAIGFEAPPSGQAAMSGCASGTNDYFNATGRAGIIAAFESIAGEITKLRLTQ